MNPIELTDLKCKTHPGSQITGEPEWFDIEAGKWVLDTSNVECSGRSSLGPVCVYTYTVTLRTKAHALGKADTVYVKVRVDETDWI